MRDVKKKDTVHQPTIDELFQDVKEEALKSEKGERAKKLCDKRLQLQMMHSLFSDELSKKLKEIDQDENEVAQRILMANKEETLEYILSKKVIFGLSPFYLLFLMFEDYLKKEQCKEEEKTDDRK